MNRSKNSKDQYLIRHQPVPSNEEGVSKKLIFSNKFWVTLLKKGIFVLLIFGLTLWAGERGKTMQIGKISWYTEQNSFAEMKKIAQKADKPIFMVFSATWCGPCKYVKKEVLEKEDFKQVADQVVLLYIEETDPESKDYIKENKISAFPTFKIFSKDGILLDNGFPDRTVAGFSTWVKEVKSGNNLHDLSQKLEKEPNNRALILKVEKKLRSESIEKRLTLLRKVVKMNPDFNDPLTQEANEKIATLFCYTMYLRWEADAKENYATQHNEEFMKIINAYYPDKFKFSLKGISGLDNIINWHNTLKKFDKTLFYFENLLKKRTGKINIEEDIRLFPYVIKALLHSNREKEADEWLARLKELIKDVKTDKKRQIAYWFNSIYDAFIEYYGEKGNIKEGKKYADLLFDDLLVQKRERQIEFYKAHYAKSYLLFADEVLKKLEEKLKTAKDKEISRITLDLAAIYAKQGKHEKARKYLYGLYENKSLTETLQPVERARFYIRIVSTMVDSKIVEKKSLEIAEKAVKLDENDYALYNLASVHAELGNFEEAVKYGEKALKLAFDDFSLNMIKPKLEKWQKKLAEK